MVLRGFGRSSPRGCLAAAAPPSSGFGARLSPTTKEDRDDRGDLKSLFGLVRGDTRGDGPFSGKYKREERMPGTVLRTRSSKDLS